MGISVIKKRLEIIGLGVSTASALLEFLNKEYDVFWSLEYAPEILLFICCLGLIIYGVRTRNNPRFPPLRRSWGTAIVFLAPTAALIFWATLIRLPPDKQKQLDDRVAVAEGYESLPPEYRDEAIKSYREASRIAPWRGSLKKKLKELQQDANNQH